MKEKNSLQEIMKVIKKRLFLIISVFAVITGITAGVNYFFLPEIYQAQTQILVNQKNTDEPALSWAESEADLQLIDTYNVIIKSPAILNKVIEELKLNLTSAALSEQITVSNEENSKVVNIFVEDPNAKKAAKLANKVADVFKEEIPTLMSVDNINILSSANLSDDPKPVKPNKSLNIAISAMIGLLLGIGLVFLIEVIDTTIKDENDIEAISKIPIIGVISSFEAEKIQASEKLTRRNKSV
ncbi:capsular biosynthesis protein [Lysinibacillus yapensis]|uniref:Capsular biosynthesis protein n=1 Tax=Ureibacillus yapensis TaxID=2304605 RepID=A0A396SEH9_9BACL|nr:Wzz/FepE/Etk N-terminal domain-containing protein [Lysinibacillus yapensis]RHW39522.1 capsular biosynthesis protein [Lysinibacillus yapensis]